MASNSYDDYFAEVEQRAAGNTQAAQSVPPQAAVDALTDEKVTGVPAVSGMYSPGEGNDMGVVRRTGAILKASPPVQRWAQDPAKAAATSDDYDNLAVISGHNLWKDLSDPFTGSWQALGRDAKRYYSAVTQNKGADPNDWRTYTPGLTPSDQALGSLVKDVAGLVSAPFAAVANAAYVGPGSRVASNIPMLEQTNKVDFFDPSTYGNLGQPAEFRKLSKEEARVKAEEMFNLSLWGITAKGAGGKIAETGVEPVAPKPSPPMSPLQDAEGRWPVAEDGMVVDPNGTPVTFKSPTEAARWVLDEGHAKSPDQMFELTAPAEGLWGVQEKGRTALTPEQPGPGVDPAADSMYKVQAAEKASSLKELEDVVAGSKTMTRSPELMQEFLSQQAPNAVVYVDPMVLRDIWASGGRPFEDMLFEIGKAFKSGAEVEIPLAKYLAEVSGQSFADTLRPGVRMGVGVSPLQAKEMGEADQVRKMVEEGKTPPEEGGAKPGEAEADIIKEYTALYGDPMSPEEAFKILDTMATMPETSTGPAEKALMEKYKALKGTATDKAEPVAKPDDTEASLAKEDGYEYLSEYYKSQTGKEFPEPEDLDESGFAPEEVAALAGAKQTAKIAAQQVVKEQFLGKLFKDAKSMGMTEQQYKLYSGKVEKAFDDLTAKLWKKTYDGVKAQYTREFKDTYQKYYPVVTNEVLSTPEMKAEHSLRYSVDEEKTLVKDNALVEGGKPITFYHGTSHVDIEKWQVGKSSHKVISFSYDPEFSSNWAGFADEYNTPVVYIVNIKAKSPADFRKEEDVKKATDWYSEQYKVKFNAQSIPEKVAELYTWGLAYTEDGVKKFFENYEGHIKDELKKGNWQRWENPEMWGPNGWDAAHMKEGSSSPSMNISVADGNQVFFKYVSGIDEVGYKIKISSREGYDKVLWESLPKNMFAADGQDVEELAEVFGFNSGVDMLRALSATEKARGEVPFRKFVKDTIDAKTRQLAINEVGDLLSPERIYADASSIFAAPEITDILSEDLKILADKAGLVLDQDKIKAEAKSQFDELPVRRGVKIRDFELAMGRQGRQAEVYLLRGKFIEAFQSKQRQLMNHYMLIEAHKLANTVRRTETVWKNWAKRSQLTGMAPEYQDWLQFILAKLGYKVHRNMAEILRRLDGKTLPQFIMEQLALGYPIIETGIPIDPADPNMLLSPAQQKVQDYYALREMLASIAKNGRMIESLFVAGKRADKAALIEEMGANGIGLPPIPPNRRFGGVHGLGKSLEKKTHGFDASLRKIENIAEYLDAEKLNGVFQRVLVYPGHEAANLYGKLDREIVTPIYKRYNELLKEDKELQSKLWQKIEDHPFRHPDGGKMEMVFQDLFAVALNTGNEYNMRVLAEGYGTSPETVRRFLNSHMTKPMWDFVQSIWDTYDKEFFPRLEGVQRRMTGVGLAKVEAEAFATPHGEYKGGYFPVVHDPELAPRPDDTDPFATVFDFVTTPSYMTKRRTGVVKPLWISLDGVLNRSTADVLTRIAYAEYIQSARNFLREPKVARYVREKMGKPYWDQFMPWLENQVRDGPLTPRALAGLEKLAKVARMNWTATIMGASATVGLSQAAGLANTMVQIGPVATAKGVAWAAQLLKEGKLDKFIFDKSEEQRQRNGQVDRDLRDALRDTHSFDKVAGWITKYHEMRNAALAYIGFMDRYFVAQPTWLGGYWKALNELDLPEADAIRYADKAVRESQGSGRPIDLSLIQRPRTEISKLFTVAYGYFSALYNMQVSLVREIRQSAGGGGKKPPSPPGGDIGEPEFPFMREDPDPVKTTKGLVKLLFLLSAPVVAQSILSGDLPNRKKWGDPEEWMKWGAVRMFFSAFSGVPYIRDIAMVEQRNVTGQYGKLGAAPPATSLMEGIDYFISGKPMKKDKKKIMHFLLNAGFIGLVPAGGLQIGKTLQYLSDLVHGKTHPKDPYELLTGLVKGKENK